MRAKEEREDGRTHLVHPHVGWMLWFLALIVAGPIVWVVLYGFVNPPMTLAMAVESDKPLDRIWIPLDRISPMLVDAVIGVEDSGFCFHHGFDHDVVGESWRGGQAGTPLDNADTITAKTARTIFLWPDRTWLRQVLDGYFTLLMETFWPKKRILEVYLNTAEWGDGIYGIEAASQYYFRTDAARLTSAQAARLATILPNPRRWSPLSDAPLIYYRASMIQERADMVRIDGKDACILPHA